jgi:hypothetical protein
MGGALRLCLGLLLAALLSQLLGVLDGVAADVSVEVGINAACCFRLVFEPSGNYVGLSVFRLVSMSHGFCHVVTSHGGSYN